MTAIIMTFPCIITSDKIEILLKLFEVLKEYVNSLQLNKTKFDLFCTYLYFCSI